MFKCEWNFLWDEQKCSCVETAGWLCDLNKSVSAFEAFGPPYLREMCSAIIYSSTMKLTRASLSKSFTVTDVQQAGQWFKTCCHREAELQPYCVCVFVSGVQKPNVCSKAQEVQVLIDYWGNRDDPDQLVFALCRNPSRSAEADLRREAAGRWPHALRLQHPEGEPGMPPREMKAFL